jgi:outer membrane protein
MKLIKIIISMLVLCSLTLAATIGYIDVERVFTSYDVTKEAQKDMNNKLKDYKKLEAKKMQELESAKIDGKSQEDLEKMRDEIQKELDPKKSEFEIIYQEKLAKIRKDIVAAVENVSAKIGVDVVVDKQVIITGGIDLTDQVIKKLNK